MEHVERACFFAQGGKCYLTYFLGMLPLLHGVRSKREITQLHSVFATIPVLEISQKDWIATGNTLHTLRKKGLTIPLIDVLIASVAIVNNMPVLTLDKYFRNLSAECIQIP